MKIEINLDPTCTEPKIVIYASEITPRLQGLIDGLSTQSGIFIVGYRQGEAVPLDSADILRVYAEGQQVLAQTARGVFALRVRLYEFEEQCRGTPLVRISNSEIVNLKKVRSFDLSTAGTITINLADGGCSFVSRRYVSKIKEYLGI